jgi:NADPH:quinone reductase-like Zn-dependent oxidoreductase
MKKDKNEPSSLKDVPVGGYMHSKINQTNDKSQTIRALVHERYGEPGAVLHLTSLADPGAPTGNQVRIRITSTPVHPGDLLLVQGWGTAAPILPGQPRVPGFEGVGVIEALGPDVAAEQNFKQGQRVALFPANGTWSQVTLVPAASVIPLPDALADHTAAQMLINTITAKLVLRALHTCLPTKRQHPVQLIQTAAGSAVGRLITVLALELGFKPLRLVRTREGAELLQATLPGAPVFAQEDADWPEQVRQAADGHPIVAVLDAVGGSLLDAVLPLLADGSSLLSYGLLGAGSPNLSSVIEREIRIQGVTLIRWIQTTPPEVRAEDIATAIRLARTKPELFEVAASYTFADIRQAVEHTSRPGKRGTVLLTA